MNHNHDSLQVQRRMGPVMIRDLYVPIVTAFDDAGAIDVPSMARHAQWCVDSGADGVVLFGTTGEGPSISVDEKIDAAREFCAAVPDVATIGSVTENSLVDALTCVRTYADIALVATLVLPPTYFREPECDGLEDFLGTAVEASSHPVIAYHIPGLAPAVPPEVVGNLPVWGAKDSGGDLDYTEAVVNHGRSVMVGAESTVVRAVSLGASGCIGGMGNVTPSALAQVCRAARTGDVEQAERALAGVLAVQAAITAVAPGMEWIAAYKQVAPHLHGVDLGTVRSPLRSRRNYLTAEVVRLLDELVSQPA
jgi:4-hydroxy-tetrahydrodipicolinate synthase